MAIRAYGNIRLQRGAGSPLVYATIAGVKSIDGPNTQLAFLETTDFDSSGGFREYVGGLKDPGQISMTLNFDADSTGHQDLLADHDNATLRDFRLQFGPSGSPNQIWGFQAFVESVGPRAEVDGIIEATATLRVTGSINRNVTP